MLADYHVLQALKRGWAVLSASKAQWLAQFESLAVPMVIKAGVAIDGATADDYESLAAQWYDQICGSGTTADKSRGLVFVPAYVHGTTPLPSVLVEMRAEPLRGQEQPMAANTVDSEYVRYAFTTTTTLTVHAPTKAQAVAISVVLASILGQSGRFFVGDVTGGPRYRNLSLDRIMDLTPVMDLAKEKIGAYRRAVIWSMARDYIFPPLFAEPGAPAYLSVHDADSVDAWGNHGRVLAEADEE